MRYEKVGYDGVLLIQGMVPFRGGGWFLGGFGVVLGRFWGGGGFGEVLEGFKGRK